MKKNTLRKSQKERQQNDVTDYVFWTKIIVGIWDMLKNIDLHWSS